MIRYGDLEYVSIPVVEVDMYNPKSGLPEDVTVINFFVKEDSVLADVASFIEFMALPTYITTTSARHINDEGFYVIYVELEKNDETFNDFVTLLRQFSNLTTYEEWEVRIYKKEPRKIKTKDLKNDEQD